MTPETSVLTPAYNSESYLAETIDSVIAQSFKNWEMIIVDDCSDDETLNIARRYSENDERIRVIANTENAGTAQSRNRAIENARGRYIAFLDSDDVWLPEKLARQLEFMQTGKLAFSYTAYRRISDDGNRVGRLITVPEILDYQTLLKNTAITNSTVMIDTQKIRNVHMPDQNIEDYVCWLEIARRGSIMRGLNEDLLRYRVTAGSRSRNKLKHAGYVWHIYREIEKLNLWKACWSFMNYAVRGVIKYLRF